MIQGDIYGAYTVFRINADREEVCFGEEETGGVMTFPAGTVIYLYMLDGVIKHSRAVPAEANLISDIKLLIPLEDVTETGCVSTYLISYRS